MPTAANADRGFSAGCEETYRWQFVVSRLPTSLLAVGMPEHRVLQR